MDANRSHNDGFFTIGKIIIAEIIENYKEEGLD